MFGYGFFASCVLLVLKLTNVVDLTWWWVVAPVVIGLVFDVIVVTVFSLVVGRQFDKQDRAFQRRRFGSRLP